MLAEKIIAHLVKREQVCGGACTRIQWHGECRRLQRPSRRACVDEPMCIIPLLQVLLVVAQPERTEGEPAADYARRLQNERVLALNPNFSAE